MAKLVDKFTFHASCYKAQKDHIGGGKVWFLNAKLATFSGYNYTNWSVMISFTSKCCCCCFVVFLLLFCFVFANNVNFFVLFFVFLMYYHLKQTKALSACALVEPTNQGR